MRGNARNALLFQFAKNSFGKEICLVPIGSQCANMALYALIFEVEVTAKWMQCMMHHFLYSLGTYLFAICRHGRLRVSIGCKCNYIMDTIHVTFFVKNLFMQNFLDQLVLHDVHHAINIVKRKKRTRGDLILLLLTKTCITYHIGVAQCVS